MKVLFYGKLRGVLGSEVDVSIETPCTVAALRTLLVAEHPGAAEWLQDRRVRAVVGDTFVDDTHQFATGDRVEFLAPVSGG
ncbi:MoaD/ThiS family protein [Sphingomonas alba]|uniref:MoaD/ThiS family protein n=1 Tax=Sphingomonas alba TaxID=2908208 RepID=A0ABT0RP86_9SPHN|nr:MoaD/ThiS family protein [Sphingomonas alba]MCL6684119.1 MoaD/ThiS family protein [Sphingomonas alba]